ncbi:MAG: hypothetical protein J2P36_38200 [Ktedonobacteraceae bacterium]|nr:hypothetical protein [Ktedonobacteraceae bacterium]
MIGTLCSADGAQVPGCAIPAELYVEKETLDYKTAPLMAIRPATQQINEEEVYTSFEAAISDRVLAIRNTLSHLQQTRSARRSPAKHTSGWRDWLRAARLAALALLCILIGFDLMGLLVLLAH